MTKATCSRSNAWSHYETEVFAALLVSDWYWLFVPAEMELRLANLPNTSDDHQQSDQTPLKRPRRERGPLPEIPKPRVRPAQLLSDSGNKDPDMVINGQYMHMGWTLAFCSQFTPSVSPLFPRSSPNTGDLINTCYMEQCSVIWGYYTL